MNPNLSRRLFLSTALTGIGAVAAGGPVGLSGNMPGSADRKNGHSKRLYATTDLLDNILINHRGSRYGEQVARTAGYDEHHRAFMTRDQLDELHRFLASVGVTRHQWIVDTIWNLYEDYPHGIDLLEEAARSARKHGIEFYAQIKPFEGGGFGHILPGSMPAPEGVAFKDLRGIYQLRPWNMAKAIDVFGAAARASGKTVCLQGDFHGMAFDGPFDSMEAEIELVKRHEYLDGYIFYETAHITRLNDHGQLEANPRAAGILKKF
jgi:hypothetical protein